MPERVVVLGAGPTGLACALRLSELGHHPLVVEKSAVVGGLSRSVEFAGRSVDLGPHFFAGGDPELAELRHRLLGADEIFLRQRTQMFWRGRRMGYPPGLGDVLRGAGLAGTARYGWSYLASTLASRKQPESYAQQATKRFGRRFFDDCLRGYVEKLWGVPCEHIDASWEPGRIRSTSLASLIAGVMRGRTDDTTMSVGRHGSGQFYDAMARAAVSNGAELWTGTDVVALEHDTQRIGAVVVRRDRRPDERVQCDAVVSTIPLPGLFALLGLEHTGPRPRFRSTVLVFLELPNTGYFDEQSIYVNDPTLRIGRVGNFSNWGDAMNGERSTTVLSAELWCDAGDATWEASDDTLVTTVVAELGQMGLLGDDLPVSHQVHRLPNTHPVPEKASATSLADGTGRLRQFDNLFITGRAGAFTYRDQDTTILMGLRTAEEVAQRGRTAVEASERAALSRCAAPGS